MAFLKVYLALNYTTLSRLELEEMMAQPSIGARRFGIFALVLMMMIALGHAVATQYFASNLGYQDTFLGAPLAVDKATQIKIYAPWKIHTWSRLYAGGRADPLFKQSYGMLAAGAGLGLLLGLGFAASIKNKSQSWVHGSSRWATDEEIASWGLMETVQERIRKIKHVSLAVRLKVLFGKKRPKPAPLSVTNSTVIGKHHDGRHFYSAGPEHTLVFAPTRSGKGVGLVIPTLLTWAGSVVVTDIKGENFQVTGAWRSSFSHLIYLNPTSNASARYNPLLEIRRGPESIRDAMNVAEILGSREAGKEDRFWDGGAKKILSAVILYVLYADADKTLGRVSDLLSDGMALIELLLTTPFEGEDDIRINVHGVAQSLKGASENVRGGWLAGAQGALGLWKDPIVKAATSTSDFRLKDLQYADSPVSLYLVIPPGDIERVSPLVRLFFQQLTDALTEEHEDPDQGNKHRLLMLLDEFPQFGNMAKIERAIAYTAGYGIKWFFICQGLDQLDKIYGKDNGFLSNCHTRLAYRCNDDKNAERLVGLLGETTAQKTQEGQSGKKGMMQGMNSRSKSDVEFARPLMTKGELQQFDDSRLIVMIAGKMPIFAHKVTYYDDKAFLPKFSGKKMALPTTPLHDFPSQVKGNPWENLVEQGLGGWSAYNSTSHSTVVDSYTSQSDATPQPQMQPMTGSAQAEVSDPSRPSPVPHEVLDPVTGQPSDPMVDALLAMNTFQLKKAQIDQLRAKLERADKEEEEAQSHDAEAYDAETYEAEVHDVEIPSPDWITADPTDEEEDQAPLHTEVERLLEPLLPPTQKVDAETLAYLYDHQRKPAPSHDVDDASPKEN